MTKRILFIFVAFVLFISGCATLPTQESIPTYSISGTTYYSLVPLCDQRNIKLQYDTITRVAILDKGAKHVSLKIGDSLVLVDGQPIHLDYPVDIYQGRVVVPIQFKEQVIDVLFKSSTIGRRYGLMKIKLRKVVIDPGHGGNDPGAIGRTGLREKDVNLDIAKRLSNLLRQEGVQTVLTRTTDRFIPLPTRVNIANRSNADLFVSIHANASRTHSLSGFEIYYVAPSVSDSIRASSATRNSTLELSNAEFANNSPELKSIVWDMLYTNSRAESIALSHSVCKMVDRDLDCKILGVKPARFQVLKGIRMPGVLVETGFVSNYNEEKLLKSSLYRQKMAESILEGLRDYSQDMELVEVSKR